MGHHGTNWFHHIITARKRSLCFYTCPVAGSKGGALGTRAPLGVQILSISCSFGENLANSYVGTPGELVPPPRGNPESATGVCHSVHRRWSVCPTLPPGRHRPYVSYCNLNESEIISSCTHQCTHRHGWYFQCRGSPPPMNGTGCQSALKSN